MGKNDEGEACSSCKRNCLMIHGRNKEPSSQPVISFFKIMFGDKFSQFLYLPPKFGRTMSNLVGKKLNLEDLNRKTWEITISKLKGSMAFKLGWSAFSLDHGLKSGDFVIFHYVSGSHFIVQIFDKTGFEKKDFPKDRDYPNKRPKIDKKDISKNHPCHLSDKSSMDKQCSSTSEVSKLNYEMNQNQEKVNNVFTAQMGKTNSSNAIKADFMEETYLMINRDLPCKQEDQSSMFDLSNFEMNSNKTVPDRNNGTQANERSYVTPQTAAVSVGKDPLVVEVLNKNASHFQTRKKNDDFDAILKRISDKDLINRMFVDPLVDVVPSTNKPSNMSLSQTPMKSDNFRPIPDKASEKDSNNKVATDFKMTVPDAKLVEIKKDCSDMLNKVMRRFQNDELKKNISTGNKVDVSQKEKTPLCGNIRLKVPKDRAEFSVPSKLQKCNNGEKKFAVKQEFTNLAPGRCSREESVQGKETENMKGTLGQRFGSTVKEDYKVVKNEPIDTFELSPQSGQSVSCLVSTNNHSNLELPTCLPPFKGKMKANGTVVYLRDPVLKLWPVLYHERCNLKVLTSGWEAFSKANSIQKGDECLFDVEDALEAIFKVRIIRSF